MAIVYRCAKCAAEIDPDRAREGEMFKCPSCGELTKAISESRPDRTPSSGPAVAANPSGPLGPRNLSEILGDSAKLVFRRKRVVVLTIVTTTLLFGVLFGSVLLSSGRNPFSLTPPPPAGPSSIAPGATVSFFLFFALGMIGYVYYLGLIHIVIAQALCGRETNLAWCAKISLRRLPSTLGALIVGFLVMAAAFVTIIGIPVAYYLALCWVFVAESTTIGKLGPIAALGKSRFLVSGNWWRVFGIFFVLSMCAEAALFPMALILIPAIAFSASGTLLFVLMILLVPSLMSIAMLFVETGLSLLYFDLRVRKDGLTLEKLRAELDAFNPHGELIPMAHN